MKRLFSLGFLIMALTSTPSIAKDYSCKLKEDFDNWDVIIHLEKKEALFFLIKESFFFDYPGNHSIYF